MLSKNINDKSNLDIITKKEILDTFNFKGLNYNKELYIPKKEIYQTYYDQQRMNFIPQTLKVLLQSYIGGCFFGVIMLAFSLMMASNQPFMPMTSGIEETKYKYNNMKEFKKAAVDTIKQSVHRNGIFVVRLSLYIGIFNTIMIYLPFTQNKFGDLYGYGNLDTLFYFLFPCFIISKFGTCSIPKRIAYSGSIALAYTIGRTFLVKENNKKFFEMLKTNNIKI